MFRDLDLLIRESDMSAAMAILATLGYERADALAEPQRQRLRGQETVFKKTLEISVSIHTRLTPTDTALDIDYAGLWRWARRTEIYGRSILTLAPEDDFLVLAIHGGQEMRWNIERACDVAAFIGSHANLDWIALVERARAQGCLRMVLLATSLARNYFNSAAPDAIAVTERALAQDPRNGTAWRDLANALSGLGRYEQATACYDKALAIAPDSRVIWRKRDAALRAIGKKAGSDLPANPQDADAWTIRAGAHWRLGHLAEAMEASDRALVLDPGHVSATRLGIHCRLQSCDWRRRGDDERRITAGVRAGAFVIKAIDHRSLCDFEEELRVGVQVASRETWSSEKPLWRGESYRHAKIRIAYISTDFNNHVVSSMIAGCFEHHDKARFETSAISLGPDDGSDLRQRIEAGFDRFIDVRTMDDAAVAKLLRDLEIDIAIDLNGYTGARRTGILARRPAPVQVSYLGFPGTMSLPFIDYIIADRIVIPEGHRIHYSEKVVYLPHCYLPNDRKRRIAEKTPSRSELGLPEMGFVFACFNTSYKISPEIFDIWMRLLRSAENSVLWLQSATPLAMNNLQREARVRGIAPERLVFAPRVPEAEDHLARVRLADLFWTRCPTMRTPPRVMRFGRGCRC